ncbi:MAG: molecular chaperone TorD family protein [Candidatus Omnitrophica bacterium]|nr:molecular chaperone TorD family protein [Candidatus Omnitrophota bacterium]
MSTPLEEKAGAYLFFSRLFREAPDESLVKEIVEKKLLTLAYHFGDESLTEKTFLEEIDWLSKTEKILIEHTALFVAPGEDSIPPYESYYCDTLTIDTSTADSAYFQNEPIGHGLSGFLSGTSTSCVKKVYQSEGFGIDSNYHDLSDHVACELEFMGKMYVEGKTDTARFFLRTHLGRWIFSFLEELEKQDRSHFYQRVALSLKLFLKHEDVFKF